MAEVIRYDCPMPGCGWRLFVCPKGCDMFDCKSQQKVDIMQYLANHPIFGCEHMKKCSTAWIMEISKNNPKEGALTCPDPTCKTMKAWCESNKTKYNFTDHIIKDILGNQIGDPLAELRKKSEENNIPVSTTSK